MRRLIAIGSIALLAVGAAVVAIAGSAGGTDDPGGELNVFRASRQAVVSADTLQALRTSGVDVGLSGAATTVAAPSGDGEWTVAQDADTACLVVPGDVSDVVSCGATTQLRRGGTIGFVPDEQAAASLGLPDNAMPASDGGSRHSAADQAPAGTVTFRGLTANEVVAAAAVTADGKVLVSADVADNVYELRDVPFDEVSAVRFTLADGATTAVPLR